ncbi:MAG: AbrB/MazE/SpoVT family DNA-binding domain-containing protein [Candidatus Electrothrix sp. AR4]|nr:AbrB/MazE/SpoVT family DNA-binding domain-containing protein [Candidatus Electrothrix sp. AR4]
METAKLFTNGRSQAVRLPKEFRFKGKEVFIKRTGAGILLLPKEESVWDTWEQALLQGGEPILLERNQAEKQQQREGLDELFT